MFIRRTLGLALSAFVAGIALSGCSSISGHRLDASGEKKNVGGLPIVLQVPKWATYLVFVSSYDDATGNHVVGMSLVSETPVMLGETQVYTIDPKRPAFGSLDYGLDLANGYPTHLDGKLVDNTIEGLGNLLEKVVGQLKGLGLVKEPGAAPAPKPDEALGTLETTAQEMLDARTGEKSIVRRELKVLKIELATGAVSLTPL